MASEHDGGGKIVRPDTYCEVSLVLDDSMIWACPMEDEVQIFLSENHSLSLGRESAEIMCRTLARYLMWDITVAVARESEKMVSLKEAVMREHHSENVIDQISEKFEEMMGSQHDEADDDAHVRDI